MSGPNPAAAQHALPVDSSFAPWRREAWATLKLAWPLALTQLAQIAMTTTDIVLLGWLSPQALAAGALGFAVFIVFQLFTLGVVVGAIPSMAQARGRGRDVVRETRRSVRMGFWAAFIVGFPSVAAMWIIGPLLKTTGQDVVVAELASDYIQTLSLCMVPFLCFIVLRAFVATFDRPRSAVIVTMIGMVANGVFNYALIFGEWGMPPLGVIGAGLGTTAADLLMLAIMLVFLRIDRRFSRFALLGGFWRPDWPRLREILRVGLPIGVSLLFEVALFASGTFMMGLIAPDQLAAHQIALQIASVTFMVPLGIGQAVTIRVGIAAGAGNREGIRFAGWVALALGVGFMLLSALIITVLPRPLAGLFLGGAVGAEREAVLHYAVLFLGFAAVFQIFDAIQVIGLSILRGLKDTRVPMILTAFSYWGVGFSLSAGLAFGLGWGGPGIWAGYVGSLVVASILIVARFYWRERFKGLRATIDRATRAST
ncbi:MAG: MATE family efflux transporter [Rhodospirillales bacterium]